MQCPACDSNDTTDALLCAACMDMFFSEPQGSFQERVAEWNGATVTLVSWVESPDTYPPVPPEWRNRVHPPAPAERASHPEAPIATPEATTPAQEKTNTAFAGVTRTLIDASASPDETLRHPVSSGAPPKPKVDLTEVFNRIAAAEEAKTPPPPSPLAPENAGPQTSDSPLPVRPAAQPNAPTLNLETVFQKLDVEAPSPQAPKPVDSAELAAFFNSLNAIPTPTPAPVQKTISVEPPPVSQEKTGPPPAPAIKRSLLDFVQDAYGDPPVPLPRKPEHQEKPALEVTSDDEGDSNLLDGLAFSPDAPTDWLLPTDGAQEDSGREIEI